MGPNTGVGAERDMGEELLMMNQLGMEPIDCLRSATTVAAEVIGLPGAARSRQGRSVT